MAQSQFKERKLAQVTIKQIIKAKPPQPDENLIVDAQEVTHLLMIAQIQSIKMETSRMKLKINDYTGTIDAVKWQDDDEKHPDKINFRFACGVCRNTYMSNLFPTHHIGLANGSEFMAQFNILRAVAR